MREEIRTEPRKRRAASTNPEVGSVERNLLEKFSVQRDYVARSAHYFLIASSILPQSSKPRTKHSDAVL